MAPKIKDNPAELCIRHSVPWQEFPMCHLPGEPRPTSRCSSTQVSSHLAVPEAALPSQAGVPAWNWQSTLFIRTLTPELLSSRCLSFGLGFKGPSYKEDAAALRWAKSLLPSPRPKHWERKYKFRDVTWMPPQTSHVFSLTLLLGDKPFSQSQNTTVKHM